MAELLSRAERNDLKSVARLRARVARSQLDAEAARVLAEFQSELSRVYPAEHEAWKELTAEAKRLITEMDAEIAARCEQMGIRPEFRPKLALNWYGRGENGYKERRTELLQVAQREVMAAKRRAKVTIDQGEADAITAIVADGLQSDAAQEFLARIPRPEELFQPLNLLEIEAAAGPSKRSSDPFIT